MNTAKKTARIAGLLYLILAISGAYSLMFISSQIMAGGDAAATADNILANEFLFRSGIVCYFISNIIFLFLVLFLYELLKPVNGQQAKLMAVLVIVQIPIAFLIGICQITALSILKGEVWKGFTPEQLRNWAMLFLKIRGYGILTLEIFWGLWLIPFGRLVFKSGFIPRIFGILLLIAGAGYLIESFTFLLFPGFLSFIRYFTGILIFGEIPIIFWLLIKGVKVKSSS